MSMSRRYEGVVGEGAAFFHRVLQIPINTCRGWSLAQPYTGPHLLSFLPSYLVDWHLHDWSTFPILFVVSEVYKTNSSMVNAFLNDFDFMLRVCSPMRQRIVGQHVTSAPTTGTFTRRPREISEIAVAQTKTSPYVWIAENCICHPEPPPLLT